MSQKLDSFVSNNPQRLLKIAKKLFDAGFFNCYLSPQQFNLLNFILYNPTITQQDKLLQLWENFLNCNIYLEFYSDNDTTAKNGKASSSEEVNQTNGTNKQEDDESIEVNLRKGTKSLSSLALKVRYLLWEQALDLYYAADSGQVKDEYEILEIDEDNDIDHQNPQSQNEVAVANDSKEQPKAREEDDDYDDDDDDDDDEDEEKGDVIEDKEKETNETVAPQAQEQISWNYTDGKELLLEVPVSTLTAPAAYPVVKAESLDRINIAPSLLGPSSVIESDFEKRNEIKLIKNFNKIYHNFENDQKNFLKRRKLEESDKKLAQSNGASTQKGENDSSEANSNSDVDKLINFGGAANLSLKNLLNKIDNSRDKLSLTDLELRNLILDVRKNRSKWASDSKVGQEELYEACERVVLELRGYTEHSTAFLNKVSKREAPNYYQVIKHPMDLNTVMKKLKAFQYKNKQEFVDDLKLIWKNCLTYNSDPSHFIRGHAIAMQKKTLSLIPLIPDITVRNRADVEREEAEAQKDDEKEPEEHSKATRGGVSSTQKGTKAPKKGKKRQREDGESDSEEGKDGLNDGADADASAIAADDSITEPTESKEGAAGAEDAKKGQDENGSVGAGFNSSLPTENGTPAPGTVQADDNYDDEDDNNQAQIGDDENATEDEDLEFQTWTNLTSNARFKICSKRSDLFKENRLQPETEALSRTVNQMSNFTQYLGDEEGIVFSSNRLEYLDRNDHDEPYLIEYDVIGGIPSIPYQGVNAEAEEHQENELVSSFLNQQTDVDSLKPSKFVPNPKGLSKTLNQNITLMQDIRRVCFKISLIRQMQSQAFVHHTQMKAPEVEHIKEVDIDPISRLSNKDHLSRDVCYKAMKRNVSKIVMANGFETADPYCVDVMTQVAEDYMSNLIKSIKLHSESQSVNKIAGNKMTDEEILCLSLLENGIQKPDVLHTYVRETLYKQTGKLNDIKVNLTGLLKDMLRPGFHDSLNEKAFSEDSEQYLSGDFANEIGDDFFGFRELGLDKEFGLLSQTIPLHLLHARLHNASLAEGQVTTSMPYEDIVSLEYPPLHVKDIPKQIGLLKPFYESLGEKSKHFYAKLRKKEEENVGAERKTGPDEDKLVEDEELPNKQRNNRPKVPPTGKIPGVKKKQIDAGFILTRDPQPAVEPPAQVESQPDPYKLGEDDDPLNEDSTYGTKDDFSSSLQFPMNGTQVV